jgi:pyrroline-5-carboxylate reductase
MLEKKKIAFLGAGAIAESIIAGLIKEKLVTPDQLWITNNNNVERLQRLCDTHQVNVTHNRENLLSNADIVILAMKPNDFSVAMEQIQPYTNENQLYLSLVSGIPSFHISKLLGHCAAVIRACPNTPSAIGKSATGIAAGDFASEENVEIATLLFGTIGYVAHIAEKDIDAVTALSGSGPAYIFYIIEAMEKAGEELGLEKEVTRQLIIQTFIGSVRLIESSSEEASTLYRQVMSPQGVTEAGFNVLTEYKFQEALIECIKRGTERAKELGRVYSE